MTPDVALRLDMLLTDMRGLQTGHSPMREAFERRLAHGTATEDDVQAVADWILRRIGHEHG